MYSYSLNEAATISYLIRIFAEQRARADIDLEHAEASGDWSGAQVARITIKRVSAEREAMTTALALVLRKRRRAAARLRTERARAGNLAVLVARQRAWPALFPATMRVC